MGILTKQWSHFVSFSFFFFFLKWRNRELFMVNRVKCVLKDRDRTWFSKHHCTLAFYKISNFLNLSEIVEKKPRDYKRSEQGGWKSFFLEWVGSIIILPTGLYWQTKMFAPNKTEAKWLFITIFSFFFFLSNRDHSLRNIIIFLFVMSRFLLLLIFKFKKPWQT